MDKVTLGAQPLVYPMPTFLVGADIDDKPNFMAVAWGGVACGNPPMLSVALQHHRFTYKGIKAHSAFSVNIPSQAQVVEFDYCGLKTGAKVDKKKACDFKVYYGQTAHAPLVEQCPVNLECQLAHILNLGSHALIVGEIMQTHISADCLTDEKPDSAKIQPFIYCGGKQSCYVAFGETIAPAFKVGRQLSADTQHNA
ncbi:MAG: flavin reductase family protein [Dehalococcoidia bacterium]|nr:flavin reductase family protein [Dehalococcoidia bacterium]